MQPPDTHDGSPALKGGSFFLGLLAGTVTVAASLVIGYWLEASLNGASPTAIAGQSIEPLIPLVILGIPLGEAVVFSKLGKNRSAIGVVVSIVALLGPLLWYLGCLFGWVCHFKLTSMRY